jgi:hypothetical protein
LSSSCFSQRIVEIPRSPPALAEGGNLGLLVAELRTQDGGDWQGGISPRPKVTVKQ